jgi:hydroxymethylbilane synthase
MNHTTVQKQIAIERKVLNLMQGGCQLPLGVYCDDNNVVFVSYAANWEDGANWYEYAADDLSNLAEIIVEDLVAAANEELE